MLLHCCTRTKVFLLIMNLGHKRQQGQGEAGSRIGCARDSDGFCWAHSIQYEESQEQLTGAAAGGLEEARVSDSCHVSGRTRHGSSSRGLDEAAGEESRPPPRQSRQNASADADATAVWTAVQQHTHSKLRQAPPKCCCYTRATRRNVGQRCTRRKPFQLHEGNPTRRVQRRWGGPTLNHPAALQTGMRMGFNGVRID
jgi:hypothetical protein